MTDTTSPRLLLIADDLTGALDSAVPFAARGRRVTVARRPDVLGPLLGAGVDVLAVNLGTRDGSESAARQTMTDLCATVDLTAFDFIFKKIDSRLKGHPGAELAVLSDALDGRESVVVPAIPSMGRVQRDGAIEGHGIDGPIAVAPRFHRPVEVPDIVTDGDMDRIVAGRDGALWVGARGLALALARAFFAPGEAVAPDILAPVLMAIGSRDPITQAQVADLRDVRVHDAPDGRFDRIALSEAVEVVRMTDGGTGRSAAEAGAAFAETVAALADGFRPATLLCSGGETATAVLACLGIDTLEVRTEIAPGLPVCEGAAPWGRLHLVTKSGGFGDPETLARIVADCRAGLTGDTVS